MVDKIKKVILEHGVGFLIGVLLAGTLSVSAASILTGDDISYDSSTSGLEATTVQDAIDELYQNSVTSSED